MQTKLEEEITNNNNNVFDFFFVYRFYNYSILKTFLCRMRPIF